MLQEAAAQVFERHGYAAGTTNRIAERAGVSVGAGAAVEAVAAWLRAAPEVRLPDPVLAAQLVVQVAESVTHGLVIHPDPGRSPQRYTAETVELLAAYLTADGRAPG